MHEEWRVAPGYPDYDVSDLGRVRRTASGQGTRAGHILKPGQVGKYHGLILRRSGYSCSVYIHRLVALAFHGLPPTPDHQVAHGNGDRIDNRAENLRWVLPIENAADKKSHGTDQRGEKHHLSRLTKDDVLTIRAKRASGTMCKDIATEYGISRGHVTQITRGGRWSHI